MGVRDDKALGGGSTPALPEDFALIGAYPNPFNPQTHISYHIPVATQVEIKVFNTLGQEVVTLVDESQMPGFYTVTWDGKDVFGNEVSSGVYIYQIRTRDFVQVKKMILLR